LYIMHEASERRTACLVVAIAVLLQARLPRGPSKSL